MFVNNCERHIHLVLEMKKTKRSSRPCVYDETRGRSFSLISCRNLPLMVSSEDREAMQFLLPLHSTLHSHAEHFAGCTYTADLTSCDRLSFHDWWVRSSLPAAHKESWSHKLLLLLLLLKLRVLVRMYILWYILFKEAAQVGWFSATVPQTFTLCCFQLYTPQVFLAWRWPLTPRRKLCSFLPDLGRFLGRGAPRSGWGFAPPSIDRWQRPPSSPQPGQVPAAAAAQGSPVPGCDASKASPHPRGPACPIACRGSAEHLGFPSRNWVRSLEWRNWHGAWLYSQRWQSCCHRKRQSCILDCSQSHKRNKYCSNIRSPSTVAAMEPGRLDTWDWGLHPLPK